MLLGRAAGLTEDKLAHVGDDELPEGLYEPDERAIVRYAQRLTRMQPIDQETYGALAEHYTGKQIIEISLCGLGQAAPAPILSLVQNYRDDFLSYIRDKRNPATGEALHGADELVLFTPGTGAVIDDPYRISREIQRAPQITPGREIGSEDKNRMGDIADADPRRAAQSPDDALLRRP